MIHTLRRIIIPLAIIILIVTLWVRSYRGSDIFTLGGWGGQLNFVRCDRGVFTLCISRHDLGPDEMGVFRHMRTETSEWENPQFGTVTPYVPLDVIELLSGQVPVEGIGSSSAQTSPAQGRGWHFYFVHAAVEHDEVANRLMSIAVALPHWLLLTPFLLWMLLRLRATMQMHRRRKLGQCLRCGYDLRESPERCPECGAVAGSGVGLDDVAVPAPAKAGG